MTNKHGNLVVYHALRQVRDGRRNRQEGRFLNCSGLIQGEPADGSTAQTPEVTPTPQGEYPRSAAIVRM